MSDKPNYNFDIIVRWMNDQQITGYTVRYEDGTIDINCSIRLLTDTVQSRLGVNFGTVRGAFDCGANEKLTSIDGFPHTILGGLLCQGTGIVSYSGVDKKIKHINGGVSIDVRSTHLLGFLLIPGVFSFSVFHSDGDNNCANIMNKYIREHKRDILSCQDELMDAGFIQQARL